MKRIAAYLIIGFIFLLLPATQTFSLDVKPEKFEEKLKTFDPEAVAAVLSYAKAFNMIGSLEKSIPYIEEALVKQLKAKNPNLNEDQIKVFLIVFFTVRLLIREKLLNRLQS